MSRPRPRINQLMPVYLRNAVGSENMGVNGSVTPVEFFYTVPAGKIFLLARLTTTIHDASPVPATYGGLPALSNGVEMFFRAVDGTEYDILDSVPLTSNGIYNHMAGIDTSYFNEPGASGDDFVSVRLTFAKMTEELNAVEVYPGESVVMRVNDNLLGLDGGQITMIHGTIYNLATYNYYD